MLNCVELAKQLAAIPSFQGNREVSLFLKNYLEKEGISVQVIEKNNVLNVVARTGKRDGRSLLLNGHTDTVPPQLGSQMPVSTIRDGKLFGLGTVDMKAGAAAMTCAFLELAKKETELNGEVILVLVGDEENGGANGTKATLEVGVKADYVVIGEPTNLKICLGQKSALQLEISANGNARHASRIRPDDNAVSKVTNVLYSLEKAFPVPVGPDDFLFNKTTMNIGTVFGGTAANVVPDKCTATIDFRFSPLSSKEELTNQIMTNLNEAITVKERFTALGWSLDKNTPYCRALVSTMKKVGIKEEFVYKFGSNDARFYNAEGCQVVNIGPGNNLLSHTGKEEVEVNQIEQAKQVYLKLAQELLK